VRNKILFISLAVVLALSLGLVGCTGPAGGGWPANAPQGTLTIERTSLGSFTFLPWTCTATDKNYMSGTIYESLTTRAYDSTVLPCLATNWSMSLDGKTWTFTIRQGVPFHDNDGSLTMANGTAYGNVTAADVKYTFERIACNGNNTNFYSTTTQYPTKYPASVSNIAGGLRGDLGSNISAAIEVVGTDTVIFHLVNADIGFLKTYTGEDMVGVVQKSYVDSVGDIPASNSPRSSGPYTVDSVVPGNYIRMAIIGEDTNGAGYNWTQHWRYGPLTAADPTKYFEFIKFVQQPTIGTRVADLESGAAQYIETDFSHASLTGNNTVTHTIEFIKQTDVIRLGGLNQLDTYASPARYDPTNPWADPTVIGPSNITINGTTYNWTAGTLVRKALNYAINKTALINANYGGAMGGTPAAAPISLGEWASLPVYDYDTTLANSTLDAAGYTENYTAPGVRFSINLIDDGRYSNYANAELIKGYWQAVGISVNRTSTTWTTLRVWWQAGYGKPNNIVTLCAWPHRTPGAAGDPAMAVNMAFDPSAVLGDYTESNEDALRLAMLSEVNPTTRNNDLLYFGQYLNDQATQVFLVSTYSLVGVSNTLNVAATRSTINVFDTDENPELIHRV
jgi:ABC-type transport system substrate-binding protein